MLRAILNKFWRQHPTRHQLYGHLPPISKTIQVRQTRHGGHCWRSRDKLISDVLLWNPTHGRAKAGRPARTYIQQLCEDTGCCPEDLPRAMNDREKWRERVRDIRATSTTWCWWFWWWLFYGVRSSSVIILFHYNTRLYVVRMTLQKIVEMEYETLPPTLYSSNLSLTNYHFFKQMDILYAKNISFQRRRLDLKIYWHQKLYFACR